MGTLGTFKSVVLFAFFVGLFPFFPLRAFPTATQTALMAASVAAGLVLIFLRTGQHPPRHPRSPEPRILAEIRLAHLLWGLAMAATLGLILGSLQYVLFDPALVPRRQATSTATFPWVPVHVVAGGLWLLSGLVQLTGLFQRNRRWHLANGTLYAAVCLISVMSLVIIQFRLGEKAPFGVGTLGRVLYTLTALLAGLGFLVRGDTERHRAWMIRSLLMGLVMPFDRLLRPLDILLGVPFIDRWGMEMPVLFAAELCIHRKLEWRPLRRLPGPVAKIGVLACMLTVVMVGATYEFSFTNAVDFTNPPGLLRTLWGLFA